VTELRCLPQSGSGGEVVSGFFDREHAADLAREAAWYSGKWAGIYFIPNPLKTETLARRPNRAATGKPAGGMARDGDVLARLWLYLDVDPIRAKGHEHDSATDQEKARALRVADSARAFLRDCQWPAPLVLDSGNGWHLYYRLPASGMAGDVSALLKTVAALADDGHARVDVTVANPARVMKLPGTMACKGKSTKDRPHRPCSVIEVPNGWTPHDDQQRPPERPCPAGSAG
jgi:hypothetical protein